MFRAAAACTMVAAVLFFTALPAWQLVLSNPKTGEVYARFPVEEGSTFAVGFIHSVNKSPVIDCYEIQDGHIRVVSTLYYGFGAGVQSELNPGETLSYTADGGMVISGFSNNDRCGGIRAVSTAQDHWLTIDGKTYDLQDTLGAGTKVRFDCRYTLGRAKELG